VLPFDYGRLPLSVGVIDRRGATGFITVASTTSTEESGLFGYLLPPFTKTTGIAVRVVAVGTGQALEIGERGDFDVVFVHDKPSELAFVAQGFGIDRHDVMYNDFVLVGPKADPAHADGGKDIVAAFRKIAAAKAPFVSRGDDSGTNKAELRLWKEARCGTASCLRSPQPRPGKSSIFAVSVSSASWRAAPGTSRTI
jgi:tungstate transport system substrate-binding protein